MSKTTQKPVMYSALEVATFCGVVNQTAINWIKSGYLKASTTPGGQFRVYPDDLIAFMKSRDMRIPQELLDSSKTCADASVQEVQAKTILVVDDDKALNDVLTSYLKQKISETPSLKDAKINLTQAYDGFDAGSKMATQKPFIVILDLDLPGVDGFDLCRRIYEDSQYEKPFVIVVTALEDADAEQKCKSLGVGSYFKKPLAFAQIWDCALTKF